MRRALLALSALMLLAGLSALYAQVSMPGFPPGTFQSRAPLDAGSAAFTPASLSPALWIEAGNTSNIFQSNACTTAASANSDPVGCIKDLSGNGFNLTSAADDTTRPLLQGVGVHPYLDCDGSNDILFRTASLDLYNSATGYSVFATTKGNTGTTNILVAEGNSTQTNTFNRLLVSSSTTATTQQAQSRDDAGSNANSGVLLVTTSYDNTDRVLGSTDDGAATATITGYKDSSTATGSATYTHSGHTFTTDRFSICGGRRTTSANFYVGRLYGLVIVKSVLSSTDRGNLITYMGNLAGLSL